MTLPNFLVIGAAKAGTTSLHYYLRQHPEVFMSPVKDSFFFNFRGSAPNFGGPQDNAWYADRAVIEPADYEALFAEANGRQAIGEACAGYLYDPAAAEAIHSRLPRARLIAVLRDPVERAYSSFLQQVRDGYETTSNFALALDQEEARRRENWRPIWHYRERGLYHKQLTKYLQLFDRAQLRLYLNEDLQQRPAEMLKEIFGFLEVDQGFLPDTSIRHNRAGVPASRRLYRLIMTPNPLKSLIKPLLPGNLRRKVRASVTESETLLRRPELPAEIRSRLIEGYREDVLKLQDLMGRDLSHWLS